VKNSFEFRNGKKIIPAPNGETLFLLEKQKNNQNQNNKSSQILKKDYSNSIDEILDLGYQD
jgi:hypothetical protein